MHCFRRNFQCQLSILFSLQLLKYNRWNCERRSMCQEGNKNIKRNREEIKKKKKRMSVAMEKLAEGDRIGW